MSDFRDWMYNPRDRSGLRSEFVEGVKIFLEWAFSPRGRSSDGLISCPCNRCYNGSLSNINEVTSHLYQNGFMPEYYIWTEHGETMYDCGYEYDGVDESSDTDETEVQENLNPHRDMIRDMFPQFQDYGTNNMPEEPNNEAKKFYEMIRAADQPVYPGHNKSLLEWMIEIMCFKTQHRVSQTAVDKFIKNSRSMAPVQHQHLIPDSYRQIKSMLMKLGLSVIKYDVCPNNCFLYYKEGKDLDKCPVCDEPRYLPKRNEKGKDVPQKRLWYFPVVERLQRLYMCRKTAKHMTWHTACRVESETVIHPAGSKAWKHIDEVYPDFASEPRNVRLGLSTDGFEPNRGTSNKPYSVWPVFITPYNLPPDLCMRQEFIFISLIISGPRSPGASINVMLRPLIDELKRLWSEGAVTYDCFKQQNFTMRVMVLWTISDFPAYGMLAGWSTHGKWACPYCVDDPQSFQLKHGQKPCWFDCHRKFLPLNHPDRYNTRDFRKNRQVLSTCQERLSSEEIKQRVDQLPHIEFGINRQEIEGFGVDHNWTHMSSLWELPYWSTLLIRNNLDVMHLEGNVVGNIRCTTFDDPKKSKDKLKNRKDLPEHTTRTSLFISEDSNKKPKASYTLTAEQRKAVCEWLKEQRFPDGYASNISSAVNSETNRLRGMKSHDSHVFMQRLLPIAYRDLLPEPIWGVLTEVSNFFRKLCSTEIRPSEMETLFQNIVETICKLEKIFLPAFFDSMEHLLVHLPYEAEVGGPVFYRWMYAFERKMWVLKNIVMNKNHIEGSLSDNYLVTEFTNLATFYHDREFDAPSTRLRRNEVEQMDPAFPDQLPIFVPKGRPLGQGIEEEMSDEDLKAAILYILTNCDEAQEYIRRFDSELMGQVSDRELEHRRIRDLVPWFRNLIRSGTVNVNPSLVTIAFGAYQLVKKYKGYIVNGFRFHTEEYGADRTTMCSGICLDATSGKYYGVLQEIVEISFMGLGFPLQTIFLFKCYWYDHVRGMRTHRKYDIIDVDIGKRLPTKEPYILASQASQVYYADYPSSRVVRRRTRRAWRAVCPIRARHVIDVSSLEPTIQPEQDCYQDPNPPEMHQLSNELGGEDIELADRNVGLVDVDEEQDEESEED